MAIPREILDVPRPSSTRVKKSGERYLVIKRTSKRVGKRVVPVELGTIGEIVNGKYIEIRKEPRKSMHPQIDIKDYGEVALCDKAAGKLLEDLSASFELSVAKRLYVIALLRAAYPDIRNRDIQFMYDTSFASEMYPGLALSENALSSFLEKTGMAYSSIQDFMSRRVQSRTKRKLVIDGTLKDNNSYTNDFSEFSRKAAKKGSKDLNLIYAYDLETKEPAAVKPYPGNLLDSRAVKDFIEEYQVHDAFVVLDKGFSTREIIAYLKKVEGLKYLLPLKQNSKMVTDSGILDAIAKPLEGYTDGTIFYNKVKAAEDSYLYAFRDPHIASEQEIAYTAFSKKKGAFSEEKLLSKRKTFGVIVFESKEDMAPLDTYLAYGSRWEIETMFSLYKGILDLDTVNVHGDYRVYSTEFINYLSVIIGARVRKMLQTTVLTETTDSKGKKKVTHVCDVYSYRQVFRMLAKCKKFRLNPEEENKWEPNTPVKYVSQLVEALHV